MVKIKLSLCSTNYALYHEGVRASGCIASRFLDLGTSLRWVPSFTPRPLYLRGKRPRYPLHRRVGWPQNWSGRHGDSKSDSSAVLPLASRYTDWAIPAPCKLKQVRNLLFTEFTKNFLNFFSALNVQRSGLQYLTVHWQAGINLSECFKLTRFWVTLYVCYMWYIYLVGYCET
jgi:hypothetical protein